MSPPPVSHVLSSSGHCIYNFSSFESQSLSLCPAWFGQRMQALITHILPLPLSLGLVAASWHSQYLDFVIVSYFAPQLSHHSCNKSPI